MANPCYVLVIYLLVMIEKDVSANDLVMIEKDVSANDQCCSKISVSLTGLAKDSQASRIGTYRLLPWPSTQYQQIGGKAILYKWKDNSWYFGVDIHTSGIQSEQTHECPGKIKRWRFWISDKEWTDFLTDEIHVTCLNQDTVAGWVDGGWEDQEDETFLYSEEDGPNVDCSKLKETEPDAVHPPHPRLVLLGETGVGKSTLGNQLLGCYRKDTNCTQFGMGHGRKSHTTETFWAVGNYLGKGGCITIIDTPGASDSEGRDYEHTMQMVKFMKNELKSVDVFLLLFQGHQTRISMTITKLLRLYENIFSNEFWKHSITEITFWKWDEDSVEERFDDQGMNASMKHHDWRAHYKEQFGVEGEMPTLFIDPVFPIFDKSPKGKRKVRRQPEAVDKFKLYTSLLWTLANDIPEFDCKERCSAPNEFFSGAPWVKPVDGIRGRMNTTHTTTCQLWKSNSLSSKNVKWKFNDIVIFERKSDSEKNYINPEWADKINVRELETDQLIEFFLTLAKLNLETQGNYTCENDKKSANNKVEMRLIIDGSWSMWGSWGQCSISCMLEGGHTGVRQRRRNCTMQQNGGTPCKLSDNEEKKSCAGADGSLTFCPINHVLSPWSNWDNCSMACGDGAKKRSRTCTQGRHGGTQCPRLDQLEEKEICNIKPCPECKLYEWSTWSKCTIPCVDTIINTFGTKNRKREFEEVDPNNPVCDPSSLVETVTCAGDEVDRTIICPIDAQWTQWNQWTKCSVSCGDDGKTTRERKCTEQRFDGKACDQLDGDSQQVVPCSSPSGPCPKDCTVTEWSAWDNCNPNCGHGIEKRSRSVINSAQFGGEDCGELEQIMNCFLKVCPLCGSYMKPWTVWTQCSGGQTSQKRTKSINLAKQVSEFTGMDCSLLEDEVQDRDCPADCEWSVWSPFKFYPCSRTCGGGIRHKTRTRSISKKERGTGKCEGLTYQAEEDICNTEKCPWVLKAIGSTVVAVGTVAAVGIAVIG